MIRATVKPTTIIVLVLCLCSRAGFAAPAVQQAPSSGNMQTNAKPEREFRATLLAGAMVGSTADVRLMLTDSALTVNTNRQLPIARIPYSGISEVVYSDTRFSRAGQVGGAYFRTFCCSSGGGSGAGGVVLLGLAIMLVAAPFPSGKNHYVDISWNDEGTYQSYHFELPKDDYVDFLERLRSRSGKEWLDAAKERDRLLAAIAERKQNPIVVELERPLTMNKLQIAKGRYYLVPYARSSADVALLMFPNEKLDVKELVAVFNSTMIIAPQGVSAPTIIYHKELDEIRIPDRTYKIRR